MKPTTVFAVLGTLAAAASSECYAQNAALKLKEGQLVSFVTSITKPGQDGAREDYFRQLQPLAARHGFKLAGSLSIRRAQTGDYQPFPVMNVFTWPDKDSHQNFQQDDRWRSLKAQRKRIWKELRIVGMSVRRDANINLRNNKIYRVVFVWLNQDQPEHLGQYRRAMKSTAQRLGARYLAEFDGYKYESLQESTPAPDVGWIVEWPNEAAHRSYLQSSAFRSNSHYFKSGVRRFDAYVTQIAARN